MHIIISTVDRSPYSYLENTVRGVQAAHANHPLVDPRITFCVGQSDWKYIEPFRWLGDICPLTPSEWSLVQSMPAAQRVTHNLRRCLRLAGLCVQDGRVLLLEDDLMFAKDWLLRACEAFCVADEVFPSGGFVLSLWHSYWRKAFKDLAKRAGVSDLVQFNNQNDFYGNLALMMTPEMASRIYDWSLTLPASKLIGDQLIKTFCKVHDVPILTLDPCPVDHAGDVSTLDPNIKVPRRSVNFG